MDTFNFSNKCTFSPAIFLYLCVFVAHPDHNKNESSVYMGRGRWPTIIFIHSILVIFPFLINQFDDHNKMLKYSDVVSV